MRNTKHVYLIIGVMILVGLGCAVSGVVVTGCGTPVASNVALAPLALHPGDFPAGVTPIGIPSYAKPGFDRLPCADAYVEQWVRELPPRRTEGSISIGRYPSAWSAQQAFSFLGNPPLLNIVFHTIPHASVPNLGEQAWVEGPTSLGVQYVTFVRCQAVVHMNFPSPPNYDTVFDRTLLLAYAHKLDQRLQQALCSPR